MSRGDSTVVESSGDVGGIPLFLRAGGSNFSIVVEVANGTSPLGTCTYADDCDFGSRPDDGLPDLQVVVSESLGDGSTAVCDDSAPNFGGVPSTNPADFTFTPETVSALNDLGCRFRDGQGRSGARRMDEQCTAFDDGTFGFVSPDSRVQFCAHVTSPIEFPRGDTLITVRVRDITGVYSPPAQMIVRVR